MYWMPVAMLALAAPTNTDAVLLDFYADWCTPCRQMSSTIDELEHRGYTIRRVNVAREPELASRWQASQLPCYVMVANGREVDRVVGLTSYGRLAEMFHKATLASASPPPGPPASMPRKMPPAELPAVQSGPMLGGETARGWAGDLVPAEIPVSTTAEGPGLVPVGLDIPPNAAAVPAPSAALAAASVRLRIEDPDGHSCGSGTIIDARRGWALILTCGHIFRDSKGQGRIEVDVFSSGRAQRVIGELVSYDLDRDVGLLKIRTDGLAPVAVARIATPGSPIRVGDAVASAGCDNGADPTIRHTRIRSKDKFLGPPNLQTDGQPVEGRSGGGLFAADGRVIGVCNAADPKENQGLFAALASIHAELDRAGLSYVYAMPPESSPTGMLVAVVPPSIPAEMPMTDALTTSAASGAIRPTSVRSTDETPSWQGLRPEEQAALQEIARRKAQGAEVICVVRSRSNPLAPSEVFVLDNASPTFLRQLGDLAASQSAPSPPASASPGAMSRPQ